MKKIRILSLILAFLFIFAALASCNNKQEDETTQGTTAGAETTQPSETTKPTETTDPTEPTETTKPTQTIEPTETTKPTQTTEPTETTKPTQTTEPTETTKPNDTTEPSETTKPAETTEPIEYPVPEVNNGEVISNANNLWAGVNAYYESGRRTDFTIENQNTALTIHAAPDGNTMVGSIKNSNGVSYIENTMDVFVKMENGKTYYSSHSINPITFDLYRFGMYYYELRAQNQRFVNTINITNSLNLDVENNNPRSYYEMSKPTLVDGAIQTTMLGKSDPRIYYNHTKFQASDYNYIAVDVRTDSPDMSYMRSLTMFVFGKNADGSTYLAGEASQAVANDGEFHTYYFQFDTSSSYKGEIYEFRFDFGGIIGDTLEYKNVRAIKADADGAPDLRLCRYLHFYSDKAQQVIQVSAQKDTTGIEEIGVITNVDKSRVNAIIVKDKNGPHDSLEGVDWDSVEFVGFDIEGAGIFGYILLPEGDLALTGNTRHTDTSSGKMVITEKDGMYVIVQSRAPQDNTILKPSSKTEDANYDNQLDFFMGHRIYTDDSHNFAEFIKAAEVERNPLKKENIVVDTENSTGAEYLGYDALRGMYVFKLDGSDFNTPYYEEPNKHFNVKFTVKGDIYDRNMYIMTTTAHGELQSAAILDENNLLLPINVEVGKNFSDSGQDYFDAVDDPWSEAYFPMYIKAGEEKTFNFLNLYMNWGRFPLKQISYIQLAPLYHLSTGVTETNCLLPWYSNMGSTRNLWTIPDHRPMSAPFWTTQPNHTSGGDHCFLRYTDSEGEFYATEVKRNYITSYGPTYAEVTFEHLSDDGKIKVSYTHMEMPQTDENRAYYTMTYEILEDVSFEDFKRDFAFYSMNAYSGVNYQRIGYLDENNECAIRPVDPVAGRASYYRLGNEYPYFSFYRDDKNTLDRGYINLSFLIKDAEFNLQAVKGTPSFAIKELDKYLYLTLDLGKTTLKKGDTIKINAIIMPWGSQESDYTLEDKNVRDVRENTIINNLRLEPVTACEVVENDWLPEVRLTNGIVGSFIVKGASNNSTILISGVEKLCIPVVYEKVEKETGTYWVRYNLSSYHYADKNGNGQAYDGYGVQYNEDGTYTYSFIVNMTKGEDREFRVTFSESFIEEPVPEYDPNDSNYGEAGIVEGPNYMLNAQALYKAANKTSASSGMESTSKVIKDADGTEYFRFYATNGKSEAWIMPFTVPSTPIKTGQYLIMKYRLPTTNPKVSRFEIWTSTFHSMPSKDSGAISYSKDYLTNDNQWRILVIDLSQMTNIRFETAPNGDYYANFLRFDFFEAHGDNSYIDVAYIAFDDRAEDIFAYPENEGFDNVTYYDGRVLNVATTETAFPDPKVVYEDDTNTYDTPFNVYFSAGKIAHLTSKTSEFGSVTLFEEDGYVRLNSHAFSNESDFTLYRGAADVETGRYLVIKYRASTTQTNYMQFYASTEVGKSSFTNDKGATSLSNTNFVRNDDWQIAVIDLSTWTGEFTANDDGKFYASLIRFDPFNGKQGTTAEYVDIAFIGLCDDFKAAVTYDKSVVAALSGANRNSTKYYSTETGEIYTGTIPSTPTNPNPDPDPTPGGNPDADQAVYFQVQFIGKEEISQLVNGKHTTFNDALTTGTSDTSRGKIFFQGWGGTLGVAENIQFRVLNAGGDVIQDWKDFDQYKTYPTIADNPANLVTVQQQVPGATNACYVRGYMDISAFPGKTVTIQIAFVMKGADEGKQHFIFATETNCTNTEVPATECTHNWADATCESPKTCKACGKTEGEALGHSFGEDGVCATCGEVKTTDNRLYTFIDSFGGFMKNSVHKEVMTNTTDAPITTSSTAGNEGKIYVKGRTAIAGTATAFVYRVLDAEGKEIQAWQELEAYKTYPIFQNANDVTADGSTYIQKAQNEVPGVENIYQYWGYFNIAAFPGQNVTIECAFVVGAGEYFTIATVQNVQNIEEASEPEPECEHEWVDATCQAPKTCSKCNATEGEVAEHSYGEDGACTVCGATEEVEEDAPIYTFIDSFGGFMQNSVHKEVMTNTTGAPITTSSTAGSEGKLYVKGRTAIAGTATAFVYRVLDAEGKEIQAWQELEAYKTYPIFQNANDVTADGSTYIQKAQNEVPGVENIYQYWGYFNITAFPGQNVTIECALVVGENEYFTIATVQNVQNTESAS